jgi:hypothetical protein
MTSPTGERASALLLHIFPITGQLDQFCQLSERVQHKSKIYTTPIFWRNCILHTVSPSVPGITHDISVILLDKHFITFIIVK